MQPQLHKAELVCTKSFPIGNLPVVTACLLLTLRSYYENKCLVPNNCALTSALLSVLTINQYRIITVPSWTTPVSNELQF